MRKLSKEARAKSAGFSHEAKLEHRLVAGQLTSKRLVLCTI